MRRRARPAVPIRDLHETVDGASHRVSARVDGVPVWFESVGAPLRAAPEAFGSAFLIPALHRGARLELDAPVCPVWHANLGQLLPIFQRWWGIAAPLPVATLAAPGDSPGATRATALCFSAGVDSFYTLLRSGERIDRLVTMHGFDFRLDDEPRMSALAASLSEVSARVGIDSIVIRTNVRAHPLMKSVAWERSHGGVLAAIGHLLDGSLDTLLISASIQRGWWIEPWGSHWETDPLWSSSRMRIVSVGEELFRAQKIEEIAGEPLAWRHLRVCRENRAPTGNCSRCEKCVSTRVKLEELGMLRDFPVFEGAEALVHHVNALPRIAQLPRIFGALASSERLPPELTVALRDLIWRTRRGGGLPQRLHRYLRYFIRKARSFSQAVASTPHRARAKARDAG